MRFLGEIRLPVMGLATMELTPFLVGAEGVKILIQIIIGLLTICLIFKKLTSYAPSNKKWTGLLRDSNNNGANGEDNEKIQGS